MINLTLVDAEDVLIGKRRRGIKKSEEVRVLTKKSSKEKEDLIEKSGLKGKKQIEVKKTIRIPVHYDVTKNKMDMLDRLTARITYGIRLIGELVSDVYGDVLNNYDYDDDNDDTVKSILKLAVIEELVKDSDIIEKTGLSSGFIQQCINKVIWMLKSHRKLHKEWEGKIEKADKRLDSSITDKEREKGEKWLEKLEKREPSRPFGGDGYHNDHKISCRFDYRTGVIEEGKGKLSKLWINISTLEKGKKIDIPLNPSQYHINQLKDAVVDDFEIIKGGNSTINRSAKKNSKVLSADNCRRPFNQLKPINGRKNKSKYYVHVSITKVIEEKVVSSIGGIDQGLNKSIAAVLLPLDGSIPREEQLLDSAKVELLEKYDEIVASLQEAEKWDKLRELRDKRDNVSVYHDWCLANQVAKFTEGAYVAIGNSRFRQGMFRGNEMPGLRKRIGKWSYSRQRKFIDLKRSEMGYRTELIDEYGSSRECCKCHSKLTRRVWGDGFSYILCHYCGTKIDADINAGYNLALRCRDDRLKAGMITVKNSVSL